MSGGGLENTIRFHARVTRDRVVRTRLRMFLRNPFIALVLVASALFPVGVILLVPHLSRLGLLELLSVLFLPIAFILGALALGSLAGLNKPQSRAYFRDGVHFVLTDEACAMRSMLAEARVSWELCSRALELRDCYLLQFGYEQHLVPKVAFAPGDEARFRALVRRKLGKRARLQGSPASP